MAVKIMGHLAITPNFHPLPVRRVLRLTPPAVFPWTWAGTSKWRCYSRTGIAWTTRVVPRAPMSSSVISSLAHMTMAPSKRAEATTDSSARIPKTCHHKRWTGKAVFQMVQSLCTKLICRESFLWNNRMPQTAKSNMGAFSNKSTCTINKSLLK